MHATGKLEQTEVRNGTMYVTFALTGGQDTADGLDGDLVIDAQKRRDKRSKKANAYCWEIIGKVARQFSINKWALYLHCIREYGVFQDIEIAREALPMFRRHFRLVEEFDDGYGGTSDRITARCYFGSSKYNAKEMSDFINGVVAEAKDAGIETLTPDEIAEMVAVWKGE